MGFVEWDPYSFYKKLSRPDYILEDILNLGEHVFLESKGSDGNHVPLQIMHAEEQLFKAYFNVQDLRAGTWGGISIYNRDSKNLIVIWYGIIWELPPLFPSK